MKSFLFIGGPIILFTWFAIHSDLLTFADQHPGMVHLAGVPSGGTFLMQHKEVYQCDESGSNCVLVEESTEVSEIETNDTEFSEVEGLELELDPIEYRDGVDSDYNKTKQPGIAKYTDIHLSRPTGFDYKSWKFMFEREAAIEAVEKEFDEKMGEE